MKQIMLNNYEKLKRTIYISHEEEVQGSIDAPARLNSGLSKSPFLISHDNTS